MIEMAGDCVGSASCRQSQPQTFRVFRIFPQKTACQDCVSKHSVCRQKIFFNMRSAENGYARHFR